MEPDARLEKLKGILAATGGLAVAYSGGCDSTLLLAVAREVLGDRVVAITADSPTLPRSELTRAKELARGLGVEHVVIVSDELGDPAFRSNPPERCYICKRHRFERLLEIAASRGLSAVADGANADDDSDFRPGAKAARELGILSPLKEIGLTKADIRELSRRMGLQTAELPASACLATRLPYGEEIAPEKLARVEAAEELLRELGFGNPRVRLHGDVARIEMEPDEIDAMCSPAMRANIADGLRRIGFAYVALDLEGYRMGSMNEPLEDKERP